MSKPQPASDAAGKKNHSQSLPQSGMPPRRIAWFILYSAVLLSLMASTVARLFHFASDWDNTNASHVLLIPFIGITLIYLDRAKIFRNVNFAALPGMAAILFGVGTFLSSGVWGTHLEEGDLIAWRTASVVAMWLGGFLLIFGPKAFRAALFPLLFLFFCSPIPSPILNATISILQRGSTEAAFLLLKLSGTPIYREGFRFAMPGLSIVVAPECSGIRSGISLLILTMLAGHLMLRSFWRWVLLVLVAIPILFFKNALRITTLSLLAIHLDKRIMTSELHREGGIPFFGVGLLLIYPALRLLARSEKQVDDAPADQAADSSGQTA